jgi:hypothetical protein
MKTQPTPVEPSAEVESNSDEVAATFVHRLDSGEFDGHLFEEIRKLRVEHLARICRIISQRHAEENES